jgi:alpha-amylase/alpha-mannosidase (GH57 family)
MKTRLALLWHMHQPMYTDPATGDAILPWVRLHATHAYYDMGRMLERHPKVKATVNFVPSLLEQLENAARGTVRERFLDLTRAAPAELSHADRSFVIRQFFMISRERGVNPLPRYRELLDRRGEDASRLDVSCFDDQDVLDLQVLFNLAWMGFAARADEPDVARLLAKGRHFTDDDKRALLAAQQRLVERIVPLWRRLAERGQVELSSTPYFHPILPLVCDSDAARRAMPEAKLPPRFSWPDDARRQVRLSIELHERLFGSKPKGMWPAEGSVSPEALEVFASEGIGWLATDEGVLFRSHPAPASRGELYQPWAIEAAGRTVALAFRDRALSDRVGFTYAHQRPKDAVHDFLSHVRQAAAEGRRAGLATPLVPVVLDGENAWEHYLDHGEPFLDALHAALAAEPHLETVTMSEALAKPQARISHIHSGSWIESNYRIWISHPEDNLGWELLGQVRRMVAEHEQRGDVEPARLSEAMRLILSAEGSDWFWWYGDDFDTENAAEFDALFRDRLIRAASLVGEAPPRRLYDPISGKARRRAPPAPLARPTALVRPRIDGRPGSFLDWLGAATYRPAPGHGSMYRGSATVGALSFGCDLDHLYLRLDPLEPLDGAELTVDVANGYGGRHQLAIALASRGPLDVALPGARAVYGEVFEVALPLAEVALAPFDRASLSVRVRREGLDLERLPPSGAFDFEVPDADFEHRDWIV